MGGKKSLSFQSWTVILLQTLFYFFVRSQRAAAKHVRTREAGKRWEQSESPSNFSIRIIIFDNALGFESLTRGWEELGCSSCGHSLCHVSCAVTHIQLLLII